MIHVIKELTEAIYSILTEDPVRPHIPQLDRVGDHKDIFVYRNKDQSIAAITCVSYQNSVPKNESELFQSCKTPSIAVFYTIWSYAPGAGRSLIFDAVKYIKENNSDIKRFVTLSPQTRMAEKFHVRNGAIVFRKNEDTVNYEYVDMILL
jgi:hypothetical protein